MNLWGRLAMKKTCCLLSICIITMIVLLCGCGNFHQSYSDARESCSKFLTENKEEMTAISQSFLNENQNLEQSYIGDYKDCHYSLESFGNFGKHVVFDIDAQGFLGGQYWSLVYCPDGTFCGENLLYYYQETGGNNIVKAEKLDGDWWYYWIDYDGTKLSNK